MQEGPAAFDLAAQIQIGRPLLHRDKRDGTTWKHSPMALDDIAILPTRLQLHCIFTAQPAYFPDQFIVRFHALIRAERSYRSFGRN